MEEEDMEEVDDTGESDGQGLVTGKSKIRQQVLTVLVV